MSSSAEQTNSSHFDIVIVGAGMVGLSLACALSRKTSARTVNQTLRIAIVDRHPIQTKDQWQGKDPRVSAVVKSSENFLKNVGAWDYIKQETPHSPFAPHAYNAMDVWEKDGTASIQFDSAEIAHQELGHIIENRVLQRGMYDCLLERNSLSDLSEQAVQCFFSDDIDSLERGGAKKNQAAINQTTINQESSSNIKTISDKEDAAWQIGFASEKKISAKLLIGADGPMSYVRDQLDISLDIKNLEHKAIVCHVECEQPHGNVARQIFLPSGPLALLPLASNAVNSHACSIVWSASHKKADQLMAMSESAFNVELAKAFENRLGSITFSDKRFSFPLYQRNAKSYIDKHAALIGDSAHTIHPLAGQGVNLGFMDAAVLAEEIERALSRGFAINSREVLRRYERRRRGQVSLMMESMRGFQNIYATKNADLIGLRNLGVKLLNKNNTIKNSVLSHAMGLVGDLPELAKSD